MGDKARKRDLDDQLKYLRYRQDEMTSNRIEQVKLHDLVRRGVLVETQQETMT